MDQDDRMKDQTDGRFSISMIVTTHGTDAYYTQACLESIRQWKDFHHELIVVAHNESALLRAYLEACRMEGLIDRLLLAEPNHGHDRGFQLGIHWAKGSEIFNVCNDILIGSSLIDDCAQRLRQNRKLGLIGWPLRGRSFFGARREVLDRIGGRFGPESGRDFARDGWHEAVAEIGLEIHHFDERFRNRDCFREFQSENLDVSDRRRHDDILVFDGEVFDSLKSIDGGMLEEELVFLHLLAKAVPDGATVTNIGVWRGASAIVLMDALKSKQIHFNFIDCFDLPGISAMSNQPPVSRSEFFRHASPHIGQGHTVEIARCNTLELKSFPKSDFVFLDAGHTKECVANDARLVAECLTAGAVAAFHDYGCGVWPDVEPEINRVFPNVQCHGTVAVHRSDPSARVRYESSNGSY